MSTSTSTSRADTTQTPAIGFVLLAAVTLFWGANWPGMKIALGEVPIWWFRSLSVGIGGMGLLLIALASSGTLRIARHQWGALLVCTIFNIIGWHMFTGYGVSLMPAGRASIIAFTMPVWASLLGTVLLDEKFTRAKVVGLIFGVAGLAVLIGPDLIVLQTAPLGAIFMLMAAMSWALGTVLFKRTKWTAPVAAVIGWQLLVGAIPITAGAFALETFPDPSELSTRAIIALIYLFAIPMIFCQWAYFRVVQLFPAAIAAIGTMAVPIVGVYSSALILGEPVGWREVVSLILICSALASVLVIPALKARRQRPQSSNA